MTESQIDSILHQVNIRSALAKYRSGGAQTEKAFPFREESALLSVIKTGDRAASEQALDTYTASLLLYTENNTERFRNHAAQVCGVMARFVIEKGADHHKIMPMSEALINKILRADSIQGICSLLYDNLEIYCDSLFHADDNNSNIVRKVSEYIAVHYSEPVSLVSAAEIVNLNPSYLSRLFHEVTGISFKDYLNRVRIDESKRLLAQTNYSILEIAVACGYNDQSYFSRIFKKTTGVTPRLYRLKNN